MGTPSESSIGLMSKAQRMRVMTINKEFMAMCIPGQMRRPNPKKKVAFGGEVACSTSRYRSGLKVSERGNIYPSKFVSISPPVVVVELRTISSLLIELEQEENQRSGFVMRAVDPLNIPNNRTSFWDMHPFVNIVGNDAMRNTQWGNRSPS